MPSGAVSRANRVRAETFDAIYAPLDRFVFWLAQGFDLPFIVEPDRDHHGAYCITLIRPSRRRRAGR